MILPDNIYSKLKWVLLIVVPAFITFLTAVSRAWAWDIPLDAIVLTISAAATFTGIIFKISNDNFYKKDGGET